MRYRAFVASLVFVFIASFVSAQQTAFTPGAGGKIIKLSELKGGDAQKAAVACGDYFYANGPQTPNVDGKVGVLSFFVQMDKIGEVSNIATPMFGFDKYQVRIVNGPVAPRMKVLRSGGPVYPWVEIIISKEDLAKSPCLSKIPIIGGKSAND